MHFVDLFCKNGQMIAKTGSFMYLCYITRYIVKRTRFCCFLPIFVKQIYKPHKITSYACDRRKKLIKNFWSHGTSLGYLGPESQEALGLGACRFQIQVIWGQNESPVLMAFQDQAKNPKAAGAWCEPQWPNV